MDIRNAVRNELNGLADEKYRRFLSSLIPGKDNILGVRQPQLKKMALQIARGEYSAYAGYGSNKGHGTSAGYGDNKDHGTSAGYPDWRDFLIKAGSETYEEVMLHGLVIGFAKADIEEILSAAAGFIPLIDNWAVCDSFCSVLKITQKHRERVWEFLQPYLVSDSEYEIRFGIVMLLNYYVLPEYAPLAFSVFDRIRHEGYYVRMGIAWAVSAYYIALPEITYGYLLHNGLDDFTHNKALQKITESLRVDMDTKGRIRKLKRN